MGEKLEKLYLGKLDAATLEQVSDILGYDIQSRDVIVTNDDVKHILDRHSDLTGEAIDSIIDVVAAPDHVYPGHEGTGKNKEKTGVIFEKQLGDGSIVCVQFDNPGRNTLQLTTVYTTKTAGATPSMANTSIEANALTSETTEPVGPAALLEKNRPTIPDAGTSTNPEENARSALSQASSDNNIPPVIRDVNGQLQFGILLPTVENPNLPGGNTQSRGQAEDMGPLPPILPGGNLDSGSGRSYNSEQRLTEEEQAALLDYKSSGSYTLNAAIRDGRLDEGQRQRVAELDRALERMPAYQGRVYRRMNFDLSGPEALAAFLAEHAPGELVRYPAYTSTSTSPEGYPVDGELTVSLVIEGQNGRDVDGVGNNFEREILFPRNSVFLIEGVETDGQGKPVIYMREMAENGKGTQQGGTGGAVGRDHRGQQEEPAQELGQTVQQVQEEKPDETLYLRDVSGLDTGRNADGRLPGLSAEGEGGAAVGADSSVGAAPAGFDPYSRMLNEYGAIPEGENPARVVDVPVSTDGTDRVSRAARTVMEAEATPENMLGEVADAIARGELSHKVNTDKAAAAKARATVKDKGWDGAMEQFHQAAQNGRLSKDNAALGQVLLNNAMNAGDSEGAIRLLVDYASLATAAGQTLQAQRMLKKLTPEGQLYGVQRSVANIREELQKKYRDRAPELEIPEELIEEFRNATDQAGRAAAAEEIYRSIAKQVPSTWTDKWNAWRYMAMLTNPRTHSRNIVGNVFFMPFRLIKNAVATTLEGAG